MLYQDAVEYLYSFLNFETASFRYRREFNLRRMRRLLDWFDHPENSFQSILVAGTNGKGSTAALLTSILLANGYVTGLYTSPHLQNVRERIRFAGRAISKSHFAGLMSEVRSGIESHRREIKSLGPITFFEVSTLLAILHFARRRAEFGVFEVGMGGRLDATNVLTPLVCIFTPIGHDHMEHLGGTIRKIAAEKAAIVKPGREAVVGEQLPEARSVFKNRLRTTGAKGYFLGSQFRVLRPKMGMHGSQFDFQMSGLRLNRLKIGLRGRFQIDNAAAALTASQLLKQKHGYTLRERAVRKGLATAFWPGRFEVLKRNGRTVVLDGAHNEESIRTLCEALRDLFPHRRKMVVLGMSRDKALKPVLKLLASVADGFVLTQADNPRAREPRSMIETLRELKIKTISFWAPDISKALAVADRACPKNGILVVTGSLFLIGEARRLFRCRTWI